MADKLTPESVVDKMLSPEGQASLEPLKKLIDEMGFTMKAEELLIAAQKNPDTAGKSPAEVADMIRAEPSLYDDLEAMASGKMDQMKAEMGVKPPKPAAPAEAPMPPAPPPEMM